MLVTLAPASGALRIVATDASAPASAHTIVEVRFTGMADSRAASELSAAARTAMPVRVRLRNQPSPATRAGNTTAAITWSARTITSSSTTHCFVKAVGKAA